jgi:hypothetical protein
VSKQEFQPSAAGDAVRAALAAADRRRRAREASRLLWRAAPVIAAAGLAVAVLRRWTLWSAWTPAVVLIAGAAALLGYILIVTRAKALSDPAAAAIDRDAALGGELRSASWFASRDARDRWADHHLELAAARLGGVDWTRLYPRVRAPRARVASVAMIAAALALTFGLPQRASAKRTTAPSPEAAKAAAAAAGDPRAAALLLPPELMQQLEALLAAAQKGDTAAAARLATNEELRELLNKLAADPDLLAKLAKALAATDPQKAPTAKELKALAERARRAAETSAMSQDMREAMEKMAEEAEAAGAEVAENTDEGQPMTSDGPEKGKSGQSNASSMQELSVQLSRQADAGGGAGLMMMSSPDNQGGGPPGSGVGGAGGQEQAAAAAAALAAAFKQEVVEASQDNPGDNVDTEIRRKTEQGSSKIGFTQSAAGQFDKSRAAAPPPVPEARRSGVQSYFVRKPQ